MIIPKPNEGGDFKPSPPGTHFANCYRFIDLGTQMTEYNGEKKTRHEVMISWELSDEFMDDGKPFTISKRYTWSMHEKATLRKDLEAWRGKSFTAEDFDGPNAFDTKNIIAKPCMLTVTQETKPDGKTVSKIVSVGKLLKGTQPPAMVNRGVYLALTPDEWSPEIYGALSDYYKQLIAGSPEYKSLMHSRAKPDDPNYDDARAGYDPSDDIPF